MAQRGATADPGAYVHRVALRLRCGLRSRLLVLGILGMPGLGAAESAQRHSVDEATGIETWATSVSGVSVSLTQILPDQVRAFYVNRGFSVAAIEPYATSCVYMTVLRNDAASGVVHYRRADWRIATGSRIQVLPTTDAWTERLQAGGPGNAAMIAFRWAQFPAEHAYQPGGDWNQGMLSIGLEPGARFDLIVNWEIDGRPYKGELRDVRCAGENP